MININRSAQMASVHIIHEEKKIENPRAIPQLHRSSGIKRVPNIEYQMKESWMMCPLGKLLRRVD
jgi:hypothetical protein